MYMPEVWKNSTGYYTRVRKAKMLDAYTEELIQEEFNKRITIGEDFVAWLQQEGEKVDLDPDTVQETIKDFLR